MTRFLSSEWTAELRDRLKASRDVTAETEGMDITIQQIITGTPEGETKYWTKFSDGTIDAQLGETSDPDITITQDYDTAAELSRNELRAQAAFMQGRLNVKGNMGKLLQNQAVLQVMGPVMATIETEY